MEVQHFQVKVTNCISCKFNIPDVIAFLCLSLAVKKSIRWIALSTFHTTGPCTLLLKFDFTSFKYEFTSSKTFSLSAIGLDNISSLYNNVEQKFHEQNGAKMKKIFKICALAKFCLSFSFFEFCDKNAKF